MVQFQSAPRSLERGDDCARGGAPRTRCFNPRPALSNGATRLPRGRRSCRWCFNPRPALSNGATPGWYPGQCAFSVSIRAPLSRTGRLPQLSRRVKADWFQSAPRSLERGDAHAILERAGIKSFNPRPALSNGATFKRCHSRSLLYGFNPRPALSNGATRVCQRQYQEVSEFQSAPRSLERGDWPSEGALSTFRGFNPRPALSNGATPLHLGFEGRNAVSIRAPLSRTGRLDTAPPWSESGRVSIRAPLSRTGRPRSLQEVGPQKFGSGVSRTRPLLLQKKAGGFVRACAMA